MTAPTHFGARIRRRTILWAGAVLVLAATAFAGTAVARTLVLWEAPHASVSGPSGHTAHEAIAVNINGRAVYWLSGDSKTHPECTASNGCLSAWPAVKVTTGTPAATSGIHGTLGVWKRAGFDQLTLNGHPLYTFSGDSLKDTATGQGTQELRRDVGRPDGRSSSQFGWEVRWRRRLVIGF